MILAVDAHYTDTRTRVAGVAFEDWQDRLPQREYISFLEEMADYEPGLFFKRELPGILKLIADHNVRPEIIVVDGYVYLDGHSQAGLGKHLYDALAGQVGIIGIAKKPFKGIAVRYEVYRGDSRRPLYVTTVGLDLEWAKTRVRAMHGPNRLPTLLKRVDRLCRGIQNEKER